MAEAKPSPQPQPAAQQPALKPEEKLSAPKVEGFKLFGKRTKEIPEMADALAPLSFLELAVDGDCLAVLNVESRDIQKSPYLFSTLYLKPDVVEVIYTLAPGTSPRKRRIDVIRHTLNILSLLTDAYHLDDKYLFQVLQSALADITDFASGDYKEIYAKYDSLKVEYGELKANNDSLQSENEKISRDLISARTKGDELAARLSQLESYSDETLMARAQDWLDVHKNEINITEFAKQNNVSETRVEDILNKMVTRGYLEVRG